MAVTTTQTNKPLNPRGNDQSPKGYNRAELYSGKALDFDGVNDSVDLDGFTLSGTTATISLYLNIDAAGSYKYIFDINPTRWVFGYGASSTYLQVLVSGSWYDLFIPVVGEWYKIDLSINGTNLDVYANGVLVNTLTMPASISWASATDAVLAASYDVAGGWFNGQIAGFKIFNTALTAAQVADLYNNPEKVVPTGVDNTALKLWLPMQEGAGTTAYDGSGNGNHGTISGATYVNGIGAPVAQTAVIDWNKGSNLAVKSQDFSATDWQFLDSTKVSTSETDPIGGSTAVNVTWSNGDSAYLYQAVAQTGAHTVSMYVKSNGGGNDFRLFGDGVGQNSSTLTATNEWQRFDFSFTGAGGSSWGIRGVSGQAADLLVAFAQLEANASVGPYIPTLSTAQTSEVLLPQGLTTGRDITGVNLFENVRKQGALNLDGNSWAEVHDNASLDITSAITLEAWVYWDAGTDNGILGKWYYTIDKRSYLLYQAGSTTISFYTSSNGLSAGQQYISATATNGWRHIVGTDDGTTQRLYIDGAEVNNGVSPGSIYESDQKLNIGTMVLNTQRYPYDIAQPRIYNRALTAEEVERNYNAGKNIYK